MVDITYIILYSAHMIYYSDGINIFYEINIKRQQYYIRYYENNIYYSLLHILHNIVSCVNLLIFIQRSRSNNNIAVSL